MDLGIAGRRAAVAAASSGLGLASAQALAVAGAHVAICGRDPERLDVALAAVRQAANQAGAAGNVVAIEADVSTPEGATAFVASATAELGGVDIVVPNAGGPPPGNFASTPLDAYPDALALNLLSVVAMCQAAVPAMQAQRWGRVAAITSISVRQPMPNLILSNTARSGATSFLKTLALEVASDGVTVNSVQPGVHATPRMQQLYGEAFPDEGVGDPTDFGQVVAFLCSEQAKFITGAALNVDGGSYLGLQ